MSGARIHPTARIEEGAVVGADTAVWDHVHLRRGARIGRECIIGEKTYVAGGVVVGDRVKINAFVYLCAGVTLEDGVMVAAGAVFTNDPTPRATDPELSALRSSEPWQGMPATTVCRGATVGARAVVRPGVRIGTWAMVGMGAVVTGDVPGHGLVLGNPARHRGWVCACGTVVARWGDGEEPVAPAPCPGCGRVVPAPVS